MALSPNGERIAYTAISGGDLRIVIMELETAGQKRTVKVEPDRDRDSTAERTPTPLRFMRWATASRLVYAPIERTLASPPPGDNGSPALNLEGPHRVSPILAVDADGKQRGTLIDARDFLETSAEAKTLADLLRTPKQLAASRTNEPVRWRMPHLDILGFMPGDREQLIIGTRGGFKLPAQYLLDTRLGSVRAFGGNWPLAPGEPQIFDWYRLKVVGERKEAARPTIAWRDEELGRMQRDLEVKFPRRIVEILDWSETRSRVLFRVTGGLDPGRVFVFQRPENLPLEIFRRAPWLDATRLNDTRFFECEAPDGARLSGYLTWPKNPRLTPPPLLVIFPSGFPGRAQPAFDPEAQIFADMGFGVLRLNHRGVAGVRPQDLTPLRAAVDRVSVDDALLAVEWIAARMADRAFDRRRVATLGRGFGGYLAVRALQLQPAAFRCGIAIDAPMDLRAWLRPAEGASATSQAAPDIPVVLINHENVEWAKLSVLEQAETLTHPVFLLLEPARNAAVHGTTEALRARLQSLGRTPEHFELEPGFASAAPAARAAVYRRIEEFFNLRLYQYGVKIGPATEVE